MRKLVAASLMLLLSAAASPATETHRDVVATVVALANEMARNATEMHPERNSHLIPDTDKVVYVSLGYPIRGKDYLKTLSESYGQRRSQSLVWDKCEVTPIGHDAAAFTGWATMTEVSTTGEKKTQRAIFTAVFAKTDSGWKRILAQKSLLDEE